MVFLAAALTVALTNPAPESYELGKVAKRTVRSDRDFQVSDPEATAEARLAAFDAVVPLFILDDRVGSTASYEARSLFRQGRALLASGAPAPPPDLEDSFCAVFAGPDCARLLQDCWRAGFRDDLERSVAWLSLEFLAEGLLEENPELAGFDGRSVEISRVGSGRSTTSFNSLMTVAQARLLTESRARLVDSALGAEDVSLAASLTMALLRPNLILDRTALDRRRIKAAAAVPETIRKVAAGEVLVREGEAVGRVARLKLEALKSLSERSLWAQRSLGLFVLLLVFMTVAQTLHNLDPKNALNLREMILFSSLMLIFILLSWLSVRLGRGLATAFDLVEARTIFLAMPIPAAAMLGAIFLGLRRSVFLGFLGSLLAAIVAPIDTVSAFIYLCNGSLISVWRLKHVSERGRLIPSAALTAGVNLLTLAGMSIMNGDLLSLQSLNDAYACVASGLLSGVIASGLVAPIESGLGLTTNLKLMELGNLNRPLLRELMLAAPGTYHHSVIVGSMVEAAAEAIGANPHLARVGAYYHDIGKIRKPLYFVENQLGENRHETLTPTMSALVLTGHVKDGVEMAKAHGLPPQLTDIVEQHHGTSLMAYFFHKAKENRAPNSPDVNEGDFRYPGPRPASKEAGLVMLADVCEAATRSLTEPTPVKIQELVRNLINRIFDDGQLDASELVLRDVTETIRVFANILVGIYHRRIAYPVITKEAASEQAAKSKIIYRQHADEPGDKRLTH
jgi:putative nucleotidyltransferase with HDIG domain